MGDGTEKNPLTREDVLRLIKENGGTAEGLDLSGKHFQEGINLQEITLKGADLCRVHLEGANLALANLEGANLWEANLKGANLAFANLKGANLLVAHLEKAYLVNANLEGVALKKAHLERANLFEANLEGSVLARANLEGAVLVKADLKGANLLWAQFSTDTEFEGAGWGDYILGEEKNGDFSLAKETYWRLRHWHINAGLYDIAAKFYYREKEASRKALKWCSKSSFRHRLALQASYLVFGHGEDWKRVLYWMAGIILGLSVIYFFLGAFSPGTFQGCLYYSVASFTALGYGSWVSPEPESWAKGLGAAEALIGISMMALLLVTFVRKMTR